MGEFLGNQKANKLEKEIKNGEWLQLALEEAQRGELI
jgi:hypothetical protein